MYPKHEILILKTKSSTSAPERQHLATLVGEVVDECAVLTVFAGQSVAKLKHRGVDRDGAMTTEHSLNAV